MTETTKNAIISAITTLLLGSACATLGAAIGLSHEQMVSFANAAAPVIFAGVVALSAAIYKMLPKSNASILKGATEVPGVHGIVTTSGLANTGALKDNPKVVSSVDQVQAGKS